LQRFPSIVWVDDRPQLDVRQEAQAAEAGTPLQKLGLPEPTAAASQKSAHPPLAESVSHAHEQSGPVPPPSSPDEGRHVSTHAPWQVTPCVVSTWQQLVPQSWSQPQLSRQA
jgi:hypothetical protein